MNFLQSTQRVPVHARQDSDTAHVVTPVGGYGTVTRVGEHLVCRTERGRRGWGVHTADGALLVSGWPTRARATTYARTLAAPAGEDQ